MNFMKFIDELTDQELAKMCLRYVILNHQANIEKRLELSDRRESISEMLDAFEGEIDRRGKVWQVGLRGSAWLDPKGKS